MTQTEQSTLLSRISLACRQFYAAFDIMPERILVYFAQKPHLPPYITVLEVPSFSIASIDSPESEQPQSGLVHIPIEAYTPSKLNWDEFLLYSPQTGRVKPEELQLGPTLIKKMIEAKGYPVLVSPRSGADFFYIFNWERYVYWVVVRVEYGLGRIELLKTQIDKVLKEFVEEDAK